MSASNASPDRIDRAMLAALGLTPVFYVYRIPGLPFEPFRLVELLALAIVAMRIIRLETRVPRFSFGLMGFLCVVAIVPVTDLLRMNDPGRLVVNVLAHLASLALVGLISILVRNRDDFWHLTRWCLFGSAIALFMSAWRFAFGQLPLAQFVASRAGTDASLDEYSFVVENQIRVSGGFYDPNFYGLYLVVIIAMAACWLLYRRRSAWVSLLLVLNTLALFMTMSRTSTIGVLVVLCVAWLSDRRVRRVGTPLIAATVLILAAVIAVWGIPEQLILLQRFQDLGASAGRLPHHMAGLEAFKDHPLIGVGSEQLLSYVRQYKDTLRPSAHMVYLSWLAKYGLLGAAVYSVFFLAPVVCVLRRRAVEPWFRFFVLATFGALGVMYLAYDYFLTQNIQYIVFGMAWTFCAGGLHREEALAPPAVPAQRKARQGTDGSPGAVGI